MLQWHYWAGDGVSVRPTTEAPKLKPGASTSTTCPRTNCNAVPSGAGSGEHMWKPRKAAGQGEWLGQGLFPQRVPAAAYPCRHCLPFPCWSRYSQTRCLPRVWSWHRPPSTPDPVSGPRWPRVQSCTLPSTFMQKASTPHVSPLYLRPCVVLAEVDGFCPEYTI